MRSSKILKPWPVSLAAKLSNSSRRSRKKPLIGSEMEVCVTICATRMPAPESFTRKGEDRPEESPPSTWRLPTATSAPPCTA